MRQTDRVSESGREPGMVAVDIHHVKSNADEMAEQNDDDNDE